MLLLPFSDDCQTKKIVLYFSVVYTSIYWRHQAVEVGAKPRGLGARSPNAFKGEASVGS